MYREYVVRMLRRPVRMYVVASWHMPGKGILFVAIMMKLILLSVHYFTFLLLSNTMGAVPLRHTTQYKWQHTVICAQCVH